MKKDLSIQEIQLLAAFKTNNFNISEQEAIRIINSVLPNFSNVEMCNSWAVQSENKSAFGSNTTVSGIKECEETPDTSKVVFNNLVQKLGFGEKTETPALQPIQTGIKEPASEDIQNTAVSSLRADLDKALLLFNNQTDNQGAISRLYNNVKELFNTDYATDNIENILAAEMTGINILELASNNELTVKAFLKEKPEAEGLFKNRAAYDVIDFKETYELVRGVKYNPEAIKDYTEKEAQMALILAVKNKNTELEELLHNPTIVVDGNNRYGAPFATAIEPCLKNLERCVTTALNKLYGSNEELINEFLNSNGVSFDDGKLNYGTFTIRNYALVDISNRLQKMAEDNLNKILGGKSIEEYEQEYKKAFNLAYGEQNGTRIAEAFVESQYKGVQRIKTGVQAVGMLAMIAGQVIPVGGQAASALIYGGMTTATAGGTAVQFGEALTQKGGITEEDKKAIVQELATSAALMTTGAGISKVSSLAYAEMVMANCPRLMALSAKIGTDATLSVLAYYAITGQVDLTSEGISQLIPVIAGVLKTKGSIQKSVDAKFLQRVPYNAQTYLTEAPEKLTDLTKTLQSNKAPLGHIARLGQPKWQALIQSIETPPTGATKEAMMYYKYDSWDINSLLSSFKNREIIIDKKIIDNIDELNTYIKNITDYINTQVLKEPIVVYRDDSDFLLTRIKLVNGNTLAEELKKIDSVKDSSLASKLAKELSEQIFNASVVQERFMSTTLVKELHFDKKKNIRWEFNVPKGTKGTFIETYNILNRHGNQVEYLLQRDSKIIIKNIERIGYKWHIKADILQE